MFARMLSLCVLMCVLVSVLEGKRRGKGCPDPCDGNTCRTNYDCVPNYTACTYTCDCPNLVNCFVSPCAYNPCATGETCVDNYCGGCNYDCN